MSTITIQDIQRDPASFVTRMQSGEALVVLDNNRPVAEVTPITTSPAELRPAGLSAGQFVVPDDFDAPLPDDVLNSFEAP